MSGIGRYFYGPGNTPNSARQAFQPGDSLAQAPGEPKPQEPKPETPKPAEAKPPNQPWIFPDGKPLDPKTQEAIRELFKAMTYIGVNLVTPMVDPPLSPPKHTGNGETIRRKQWAAERPEYQRLIRRYEDMAQRFTKDKTVDPPNIEGIFSEPVGKMAKLQAYFSRQEEEHRQAAVQLESAQRDLLRPEKPDTPLTQEALRAKWNTMQFVLKNRLETVTQEREALLKKVDGLGGDAKKIFAKELGGKALVPEGFYAREGSPQAYDDLDRAIRALDANTRELEVMKGDEQGLALLKPFVKPLLGHPKPDAGAAMSFEDRVQEMRAAVSGDVQRRKDLSEENGKMATDLKQRHDKLVEMEQILRTGTPLSDGQYPEFLPLIQQYTETRLVPLRQGLARIDRGLKIMDEKGFEALKLPIDAQDNPRPWGKNVLVSASTGQEQPAIFKRHISMTLKQLEGAKSLPEALRKTEGEDGAHYMSRGLFGMIGNEVFSTPVSSTRPLDNVWVKGDQAVKKRVVLYIQGNENAASQRQWMNEDYQALQADLKKHYGDDGVPLEFVPLMKPTAAQVSAAFDKLKDEMGADVEVLVVMNGHGGQKKPDFEVDDVLEGSQKGTFGLNEKETLDEDAMKTEVDKLAAAKGVIVLLSSCHSGAWISQTSPKKPRPFSGETFQA